MKFAAGHKLGAYEIMSFLGEGAMGSVYRARDTRLGRDVALKILHAEHVAKESVLKRFKGEAHSASTLNHPNIVTVHEVGEEDDLHFIAMEYVDGERLRDLLGREPLTLEAAAKIMSGIADGLAVAHAKGIVHRDLKPENVMLSRDGFVKILDFGLAKPFRIESDPSEDEQTLRLPGHDTADGAIVGTPSYMSPEQVAGEKVDHRSDQFSFGTIFFELLARRRPYQRKTSVETMTAILRDPAPQLRDVVDGVPHEADRIVSRCLAKDPAERYSSTADLALDVRDLKDGLLGSDRSPLALRSSGRKRDRKVAFAGVTTILLALAVVFGLFRPRAPTAPLPALAATPVTATPGQGDNIYLAVLPFEALSGGLDAELYAKGTAETIRIRLGALSGLQVISPPAGRISDDVALTARKLGANLVLLGSVRHSGENTRINYTIVDPATGLQIAAGTVNGSSSEPFLVEDRLADGIVRALHLEMSDEETGSSNQGLLDSAAQDKYLRALGALQRYENEDLVDSARTWLEELHADVPRSALVGAALGRAYLYKYQITHDPVWGDRAIEISETVLSRSPSLPVVNITYGEVLTRVGRYEDAILRFRQALAERPDSAEAMLGMAEAMDRAGRDDEARAAYGKAIELRPLFWGGYNKLGVYHFRRGHLAEAADQFRKVTELTPDNARALSNLGGIELQRGNFDEAAASLRKSLEQVETSPAWSNLGISLYYRGRFSDAAEAFERAVELTPANFIYRMNLADALRWSGGASTERMANAYGRAIELAEAEVIRDGNPYAHAGLAAMYAKTGQGSLARTHGSKALSLAHDNPDVLLHVAIATHVLGDEGVVDLLKRASAAGVSHRRLEHEPEFNSLRESGTMRRILGGTGGTGN